MEDHSPDGDSHGLAPVIMKSLFALMTTLVLASMGYSLWLVLEHWDRVGV